MTTMANSNPTLDAWALSGLSAIAPSQAARLLQLQWADAEAAPPLVVERLAGQEGVNALFVFAIDTLCADAGFDPAALIGAELTLRVLLPAGSQRAWHGLLTACEALGGDGGLARHRLTLRPWLALLGARRDSHVWGQATLPGILADVFSDYSCAHYAIEAKRDWPVYPTRAQFHESDLEFVWRLLAEAGVSLRFDHRQADDGPSVPSRHRLVLFDARTPLADYPEPLRFHRIDATESADSIDRLEAARQAVPRGMSVASWDEERLHAPTARADSALDLGDLPPLEQYFFRGARRFGSRDDAQAHADHCLHHWQAAAKGWRGRGSVRDLLPGQGVVLRGHDRYGLDAAREDAPKLRVWRLWHVAANNLGAQMARVLGQPDIEQGSYRNQFAAHDALAPVAPRPRQKPCAPEAMIARVVGLEDEDNRHAVHSERDHRVQVRFYWQGSRGANNAGGSGDISGATGSRQSDLPSVWLRVATPLAGPNWGGSVLPRLGTEVALSFMAGDIDRPVVSQQLHSARDLPPWSTGAANHPGVLSGWHATSLDGSGFTQWLADDAPGQGRARIASSQAASQINLGYLIEQPPDASIRGSWRGTGAELRSDAWTALRAGEGLLISSAAQPQGAGAIHDASSAVGQFQAAHETAQRIGKAVTAAHGLPLRATADLQEFIADLDAAQKGKLPPSLNGQTATIADPGQRQGSQPVPAFARPAMVFDAANSFNAATPASALLLGGQSLHWTSQQDWHAATTRVIALTAGGSAGLFAWRGGLKAIAQAGPVSLQAHQGTLAWTANADFTIASTTEDVEILAKTTITLGGGQTAITLDGENITLTMPALLDVKGGAKSFVGPGEDQAVLEELPMNLVDMFSEQFRIVADDGETPLGKLCITTHHAA